VRQIRALTLLPAVDGINSSVTTGPCFHPTGSTPDIHYPMIRPLPFENAYWVIPGKLMAGEYPSARTEPEAERRLEAMLDAGVTYFLDLTTDDDPLDPYEQPVRDLATRRGGEISYSRRAIRDMGCPSAEEMSVILDEIDAAIADGHVVYVHCWGGIGRTGTVVGCFLVRRGRDGDGALAEVARLYGNMSARKRLNFPQSPQTKRQRDFVRLWTENG